MEWRPVRGFEGEYLVSDSGDIKSVTRNVPNKANRITVKERILKPWIDNWGYMNYEGMGGRDGPFKGRYLLEVKTWMV